MGTAWSWRLFHFFSVETALIVRILSRTSEGALSAVSAAVQFTSGEATSCNRSRSGWGSVGRRGGACSAANAPGARFPGAACGLRESWSALQPSLRHRPSSGPCGRSDTQFRSAGGTICCGHCLEGVQDARTTALLTARRPTSPGPTDEFSCIVHLDAHREALSARH